MIMAALYTSVVALPVMRLSTRMGCLRGLELLHVVCIVLIPIAVYLVMTGNLLWALRTAGIFCLSTAAFFLLDGWMTRASRRSGL